MGAAPTHAATPSLQSVSQPASHPHTVGAADTLCILTHTHSLPHVHTHFVVARTRASLALVRLEQQGLVPKNPSSNQAWIPWHVATCAPPLHTLCTPRTTLALPPLRRYCTPTLALHSHTRCSASAVGHASRRTVPSPTRGASITTHPNTCCGRSFLSQAIGNAGNDSPISLLSLCACVQPTLAVPGIGHRCTRQQRPSAHSWLPNPHTHTHTYTHTHTHTHTHSLSYTHSFTLSLALPPSLRTPGARSSSSHQPRCSLW